MTMTPIELDISYKGDVESNEVYLPGSRKDGSKWEELKFVQLKGKGYRQYFVCDVGNVGTADIAYINKSNKKHFPEGSKATMSESNWLSYFLWRLFTTYFFLSIGGLLLLAGEITKEALELGKDGIVFFHLSEGQDVFCHKLVFVGKTAGLVFAAYGAIRKLYFNKDK